VAVKTLGLLFRFPVQRIEVIIRSVGALCFGSTVSLVASLCWRIPVMGVDALYGCHAREQTVSSMTDCLHQ